MDNQTNTPPDPSSVTQIASVAFNRARAVTETEEAAQSPSPQPPIKPKLPPISEARRHTSCTEHAIEDPCITLEEIKKAASSRENKTYLYLAYGSNLAASTFQGTRGIRPLAALNVVVPEL
ncbi:MAG: hypothetical protein LQ352_007654, partial [Teloschistes flavicans]